MLKEQFFKELLEKTEKYFEEGGSHEHSHTDRVYKNALEISEGEDVDIDVVKTAALLHDIAREKQDSGKCKCHAMEGAKMAKELLENLDFPKEKIGRVIYAIESHRHSSKIEPKTREAAIIQDADRLDALGAITIGRMFSSGGKAGIPLYNPENKKTLKNYQGQNSTIEGFNKKILKITPETFKTKKAKEIAMGGYKFVQVFLERFIKEWNGEA